MFHVSDKNNQEEILDYMLHRKRRLIQKIQRILMFISILCVLYQFGLNCYRAYFFVIRPTYEQQIVSVPLDFEQRDLEYSDKITGIYNSTTIVTMDVQYYTVQEKGTEINQNCRKYEGNNFFVMKILYPESLKQHMFTENQYLVTDPEIMHCLLRKGVDCFKEQLIGKVEILIEQQQDQEFLDEFRITNQLNDYGIVSPIIFWLMYISTFLLSFGLIMRNETLMQKVWADYHDDPFLEVLNSLKFIFLIFFILLQSTIVSINAGILKHNYSEECLDIKLSAQYYNYDSLIFSIGTVVSSFFYGIGGVYAIKNKWVYHEKCPFVFIGIGMVIIFVTSVYNLYFMATHGEIFTADPLDLAYYTCALLTMVLQILYFVIGRYCKSDN